MLFQHFIFILELIFFVALIIYVCFLWRERRYCRPKEKFYLLLPASIAVILLSSGIYGRAADCADSAADILCSLLLMMLLRSCPLYKNKYLPVLSYLLIFICTIVSISRFSGIFAGFCGNLPGIAVLYPLLVGSILFLMVILSLKVCSDSIVSKSGRFLKTQEVLSYIFSISAFFFILTVSVCGGIVQNGIVKCIFSALTAVLAVTLYYFQFKLNICKFKKTSPSPSFSSVLPPPVLAVSGQNENNDAVRELYGRIVDLFDTSKPYLIDGITVSEVARMLFTNKVYISRAINDYTGKNFCQFVNYYRVMYAVRLFEENPYLKVSDLSDMSGFHNQVSFNMAFRLIMNDTPSDWCRRQRMEREG